MRARGHRSAKLGLLGVAAAVALTASACGSAASSSPGSGNPTTTVPESAAVNGGSANFALPPDATPDWIFPIATAGHLASYNGSIQAELYRPLYQYDNTSGTLALDESISAADQPVYSNGDKTVTITLKDLAWSNGKPLTSRDVQFWYDLVKANKTKWGAYTQGEIPDNIASFTIVNSHTFRLQLTKAYNPGWFTANQLSLITPLPQAAWDIESTGGAVGNYDTTTAGAQKVFAYLAAQSSTLADYDKSPLWKVSDGPFTLGSWSSSGTVVIDKSKTYTGPSPAHLDRVTFLPFTSDQAEFNELMSGSVDYGYVPITDIAEEKALESNGYRIAPWVGWAISYIPYNFNNPALGPAFHQLYVRQALQEAVDQPAIITGVWHSYATAGYGPVPQTPTSPYLSTTQKDNPYPYDLKKAKTLLTSHGWQDRGGVDVCESPGTGSTQCGAGVAKGTRLSMQILSESGSTETTSLMEELQSSFSQIGAKLTIKQMPLNTVLDQSAPCKPSQASCNWQLSFFGTQGSWYYSAYPSGEELFLSGAGVNLGSYTSSEADHLIQQTTLSPSSTAMQAYSAYLAKDLPVIWVPNPDYQVSAIKSSLQGVAQNPLANMDPEQWFVKKS